MGFTNRFPAKICTYELTPYLHFNQMSLLLKFYKATQQQGERWRDYWIIDKNIFSQLRCIHVSEKAPGKKSSERCWLNSSKSNLTVRALQGLGSSCKRWQNRTAGEAPRNPRVPAPGTGNSVGMRTQTCGGPSLGHSQLSRAVGSWRVALLKHHWGREQQPQGADMGSCAVGSVERAPKGWARVVRNGGALRALR